MLRRRILLSLFCLTLFLLHGVGVVTLPGVKTLDTLSYDWRMRLIAPNTPDPRVAIVDIDSASLATQGRWPWPRRRMAEMVHILFEHYHIRALGFDVVFAEPDTSSGLPLLKSLAQNELKNNAPFLTTLQRLSPQLDDDALFAQSLKNRRVVLGFYFSSKGMSSGQLPAPLPASDWGAINDRLMTGTSVGANLAVLQTAARSGGILSPPATVTAWRGEFPWSSISTAQRIPRWRWPCCRQQTRPPRPSRRCC
jgi:adenylate cyclase